MPSCSGGSRKWQGGGGEVWWEGAQCDSEVQPYTKPKLTRFSHKLRPHASPFSSNLPKRWCLAPRFPLTLATLDPSSTRPLPETQCLLRPAGARLHAFSPQILQQSKFLRINESFTIHTKNCQENKLKLSYYNTIYHLTSMIQRISILV